MSFITKKFQDILFSGFRGVALTNCFSSIFHFRQISKFKKSLIQRKKMESKFPVDMHIYTLCPSFLQSFRKFCQAVSEELRWQTVTVVFFISSNFEVQKERNSERKNWIKISCGYAHLQIMSFITTKFHVILLSDFRGVALTRKTVVSFILVKFLRSKRA